MSNQMTSTDQWNPMTIEKNVENKWKLILHTTLFVVLSICALTFWYCWEKFKDPVLSVCAVVYSIYPVGLLLYLFLASSH